MVGADRVDRVTVETTNMPEMCRIIVRGDDNEIMLSLFYHFESEDGGRILSLGRSYADRLALGVRVAEFFGGRVSFADYEKGYDLEIPAKSDAENRPSDGQPWHDLWRRVSEVQPITDDEVNSYAGKASYGMRGRDD